MRDPLASGECHAQEGTRALPGQPQRTGGEETPTERAGLRGCPEDLLSIGRKQRFHNFEFIVGKWLKERVSSVEGEKT